MKTTFQAHIEWATLQNFLFDDPYAIIEHWTNPAKHRCRIGKITLKQTDKAV